MACAPILPLDPCDVEAQARRRREGRFFLPFIFVFSSELGIKRFYLPYAQRCLRAEFPGLPSYRRGLEVMPRCIVPLRALFDVLTGKCIGIGILDSSPIAVWDSLRIARHRAAVRC